MRHSRSALRASVLAASVMIVSACSPSERGGVIGAGAGAGGSGGASTPAIPSPAPRATGGPCTHFASTHLASVAGTPQTLSLLTAVAAADFDGDGRQDLAVSFASSSPGQVALFLGRGGRGHFECKRPLTSTQGRRARSTRATSTRMGFRTWSSARTQGWRWSSALIGRGRLDAGVHAGRPVACLSLAPSYVIGDFAGDGRLQALGSNGDVWRMTCP